MAGGRKLVYKYYYLQKNVASKKIFKNILVSALPKDEYPFPKTHFCMFY